MAFRLDTGTLARPQKLPDGRLVVEATLTRTGVFSYRNPDGSERREYRSPTEVFKSDSQNSFLFAPVTDDHPPVMVTSDNASTYTVGQTVEVRRDGDHMVGKLVINVGATIRKMELGKREVSNGYACELDETPGVSPEGERYDARQYDIRGNHVAIVDAGRAGSARVRMDSARPDDRWDTAAQIEAPATDSMVEPAHSTPRGATAKKDIMDLAQALAALAAVQEKLGAEKARADAAIETAKATELKLTVAESEKAVETKRADAAVAEALKSETSRKDAADKFDAHVSARVSLLAEAACLRDDKGEGPDVSKMPDRAIKVAVVEKLDGFKIEDTRSDESVDLAFTMATARAVKQRGDAAAASGALGDVRAAALIPASTVVKTDADPEKAAEARMKVRTANLYKNEATKETK